MKNIFLLFALPFLFGFFNGTTQSIPIKNKKVLKIEPVSQKAITQIIKESNLNFKVSTIGTFKSDLPLCTMSRRIYYTAPDLDLSKIQKIKARIIDDDNNPVPGARIMVHSKFDSRGTFRLLISDSAGYFLIDVQDTFKNLEITYYENVVEDYGYNYVLNHKEYYFTQTFSDTRNINLKKHVRIYSDSLVFIVPAPDFRKKEKIVKEKFRFRDVRETNTRNPLIYGRF